MLLDFSKGLDDLILEFRVYGCFSMIINGFRKSDAILMFTDYRWK